jgi:hypothetical protein
LLDSHDGDINAAAEAHFNLNNGSTPSADDSPEEVVSQLFEGAKARSDGDNFSGSGRTLNSEPGLDENTREVHCAFFSDAVVFFEIAKTDDRKRKPRRAGVHTVKSTAGPYENRRELGWITSDMKEKHRVTADDPDYKAVVENMHAGRVPDFLTEQPANGARTSMGFMLHDHRSVAAPPNVSASSTSSKWSGQGHSLRDNSSDGLPREKKEGRAVDKMEVYSTPAVVLCMAVVVPLALSWQHVNVHLGHALLGGTIGYAMANSLPGLSFFRRAEFQFVLDAEKPTITVKVRFGRQPLWEEKFNPDVHTLDTLHRVLSKKVLVDEDFQDETNLRNGGTLDSLLKISYGFPRKTLKPDSKISLREAKLDKEIITVEKKKRK